MPIVIIEISVLCHGRRHACALHVLLKHVHDYLPCWRRYLMLAMVKLIGLSRLGKLQHAACVMAFFVSFVVCFDRCTNSTDNPPKLEQIHQNTFLLMPLSWCTWTESCCCRSPLAALP